MSQDRSKMTTIEERIKQNIENCIGTRAAAELLDQQKAPPPSLGWIAAIYSHLRALYEIESNLLNEIKQTNELLRTILGAEENVPTQELSDRAAILGALIDRLRNEEGRP